MADVAFTTRVKLGINRLLRGANLKLDSLTVEQAEQRRLEELERYGRLSQPMFRIPASLAEMNPTKLLEEVGRYAERYEDFRDAARNDVDYTFDNPWFTSPDAEVLYAIVRWQRPRTIIEVGCGHSTRVIRQAIRDGWLGTRLVCIDPDPRREVADLADECHRKPVEQLPAEHIIESLGANDILFIDSSHILATGGDVAFLYLHVMPRLSPGVLIHIHDVFLPYDYPASWVIEERRGYNEQYLVQAILTFNDDFEVLWAGYYLQNTQPEFSRWFPQCHGREGKSLWLRKPET